MENNGTKRDLENQKPTRYEIVDRDGYVVGGTFPTRTAAVAQAEKWWPLEFQDEERSGSGWDIQIAGADIIHQRSDRGPVKV